MKALFGPLLLVRPTLFLGLVLVLGLAACSKEEATAPCDGAMGTVKGGEMGGDDLGRSGSVMSAGDVMSGKESDKEPSALIRGFEGEDPGGGISDDGGDEGDNEKSKTKPKTN
ncbi:MAG: hypothetical protein WAU70_09460 [Flavobacteriales bacterium]